MAKSTYDDPGDLEDILESILKVDKSAHDDPQELQESVTSITTMNEARHTSTELDNASSEQSHSRRYKKSPGFSGLRGEAFEFKMCALLFSRASNLGYEFSLANSMDCLGAFDDIALKLTKENKSVNYFLQLKKKERARVTVGSLLSSKHDFSLFKLHKSYLEAESYFQSNRCDPIFNGKLENCIYILYTNADIDTHLKPYEGETNLTDRLIMTGGNLLKLNQYHHKEVYDGIKHLPRYKEFLNQFIIMYNQSNDEYLDTLIQEEITSSLSLWEDDVQLAYTTFRDFIQDWWQKSNVILNEAWDLQNPLRKTKEQVKSINLSKIFQIRRTELERLNLSFKPQALSEMKHKIEKSNAILIFAPGCSTTITASKIHKSLGETSQHRIINLRDLDEYKLEIKANWMWKYPILIVEIHNTDNEYYNLYYEIDKMMTEETRIIFIIQNRGNVKQLNSLRSAWSSKLVEVYDCTILSDFETLTQESFLEKEVLFQGHQISLSQLVNIEAIHMLQGLDANSLALLLANEKPSVGLLMPNPPEFYIDRTLQSHIFVSSEILYEKGIVFALCGSSLSELNNLVPSGERVFNFREWKPDLNYQFLYVDTVDDFNRLSMWEPRQIIWLSKEGDGFLLKQSNGDRKVIEQHLIKNYITEWRPNDIMEGQDRIILITAEPGMGKSTLLTHLTKQTQIRHPNIWIVRIDINYHSKLLHKIKLDGFSAKDAIELLSSAAGMNSSQCVGLESDIFHHCYLSTGNMVVLLDGIDEVTPIYFTEVLQILRVLIETKIRKFWLTSRPYLKSELENALGVSSYSLQPFKSEDQIEFLVRFWKKSFSDIDTSVFHRIATESLKLMSEQFNGNEIDFLGIPLQSLLLAEIVERRLKVDGINVIINSENLNSLILYDLYVDKKWQIYLQEKKISDVTNVNVRLDEKKLYDIYIRNHEVAAMIAIFPKEELKELEDIDFGSEWITFLNEIVKGEEKTGIILSAHNGKPQFVHRTFAEYFAAKWLYRNLNSCKTFLTMRIFEPRFNFIKSIFDRALSKDSPLHLATLNNDIDIVKIILANGEETNRQDEGGRTALHLAVTYPRTDIVKFLLNNGSDLSIRDNILQQSASEYALNSCSFLPLSMILEKRPEAILQNIIIDANSMKDILLISSQNGYLKLFNYLILVNEELVSQDCRNDLLTEAASHGQIHFMLRLMDMGSTANIRNSQGKTLLHISSEKGQLKVLKFLLEYRKSGILTDVYDGSDDICRHCQNPKWLEVQDWKTFNRITARLEYLALVDNEGNTALHLAAKGGHIDIIRYLVLEVGCSVKSLNKYNQSPLVLAALSRNDETVFFLLNNNGFNLTKTEFLAICKFVFENVENQSIEKSKKVSSHLATSTKLKCKILRELLDLGEIDLGLDNGNTLFHEACVSGNMNMACFILKLKPMMIDLKNRKEQTPLHLAVLHGRQSLVQYLIKLNARINETDILMNTPLHAACAQGNFEIIENLVFNNASINVTNCSGETPLYLATLSGNYEAVTYLIRKGASLTCRTQDGSSLLLGACKTGHLEIVKFLLDNGAKIDEVDNNGNTCLHLAVGNNDTQLVEFISDQTVNINLKNNIGETALLRAVRLGRIMSVKCLVNKSADLHTMDVNNETAIDIAIENGDLELVKYLHGKKVVSGKNHFLLVGIMKGHYHVVQYLVENGVDLISTNEKNQTMLHITCLIGNYQSAVYLVNNGINMEIEDYLGRTPLHYAVDSDSFSIVVYLIEHGASVSHADLFGYIPLHIAAFKGLLKVTNYLIKESSPIDARNLKKQTPLFLAAIEGHTDICRVLIQAGAGISVKDEDGIFIWELLETKGHEDIKIILQERANGLVSVTSREPTDLHRAADRGDINYLERLLSEGVAIDIGDHLGRTALWRASLNGQSSIVKLLCENGSGTTIPDCMGIKPIHVASSQKYFNIVETLLKNTTNLRNDVLFQLYIDVIQAVTTLLDAGSCEACKDTIRRTPLHIAANEGHAHIVKILLRNSFFVNLKNDEGKTPLHLAAFKCHSECVEYILENDASVNIQDHRGRTPLHAAIYGGKLQIVELLLNYGASTDIADDEHMLPLMTAVSEGRIDMVQLLLEKDLHNGPIDYCNILFLTAIRNRDILMVKLLHTVHTDVNEPNTQGTTPLVMAAYSGDLEIVQFLLQSGADINVQNNDGWTPLHVAVYRNHINIVHTFILEGGNINISSKNGTTPLQISVLDENIELTKLLLERGAEVNTVDENGCTALHLSIETGNTEIINLLLQHGANMTLMNKHNWTAFHVAARYGRKEVAEILIRNGFSLDCVDKSSVKPLYLSVSSGHIECTELLLNYGVNINEEFGAGLTALYFSVALNFFKLSQLLLERGADLNANGNENGTSPLHLAVLNGNFSMVTLLVESHADTSATQIDGKTPLHLAVERNQHCIIEYLRASQGILEDSIFGEGIKLFRSISLGHLVDRNVEEVQEEAEGKEKVKYAENKKEGINDSQEKEKEAQIDGKDEYENEKYERIEEKSHESWKGNDKCYAESNSRKEDEQEADDDDNNDLKADTRCNIM